MVDNFYTREMQRLEEDRSRRAQEGEADRRAAQAADAARREEERRRHAEQASRVQEQGGLAATRGG